MAASLQLPRLKGLCDEWARLSASPAEAANLDNLATETGATFNAIYAASSGKVAANQRGVGMLQFLLKANECPASVAIVISRPSPAALVTDYAITIISAALIETAPCADTAIVAGSPKVTYVRTAGPVPTDAELTALFAPLLAAGAAGPSAIAAMESEMKLHEDESFVTATNAKFRDVLAASNGTLVTSRGLKLLSALLIPKYDNDTVLSIRRAAAMYSAVFKNYIAPTLDNIAASNTLTTVGAIRDTASNYLSTANTLPGYEKLADWKAFANATAPQVFRSGAAVAAGGAAGSDYVAALVDTIPADASVSPSTGAPVIVRLSVRNREQCVIGSRSYFFKDTAPASAAGAMAFACAAQSAVWTALNAAAAAASPKTVADVATDALAAIAALPNAATYTPFLLNDFGHVCGPVLTDRRTALTPDAATSNLIVRPNASFYIRIVLQNVSVAGDAHPYTIEIGDSVISGFAEDFTRRAAPRGFPECLFLPGGDVSRPAAADPQQGEAAGADGRRIQTRAQLHGASTGLAAEEGRIAKQAKLWEDKTREFGSAGPKPKSIDATADLSTIGRITNGTLQSYGSRAALQNANLNLSADRIFANAPALTVWLPVGGQCTPFHMSTIKEVTVRAEGGSSGGYVCSIVFHSTQESYLAFKSNRTKIYVRELSYRGTDSAAFDAVRNAVFTGHELIKDSDKKRQSEKGVLPSSGLGIRGDVIGKLPNVILRPQMFAKVANRGTLEANARGFRFDFSGGGLSPIEIPYDNVQFCICQTAVGGDIQVIFHIALFKPIQWGKEKAGVKEFQVVATVLEASEAIDGRRRLSEAEELAQEERDRARVNATNREFLDFARNVSHSGHVKRMFAPQRLCDIDGSMGKGNVRIRGSDKGLWQVAETPFQTVDFSEIEIAFLERMIVGGKTFDLVLIPKNYRNKVVTISSIPMKKSDEVKTWLCAADLVYIEIGTNQNYPALFRQFETDPEWNPWDEQGWRALVEDSDEDGGDDSDSDSDDSWGSSEEDDESDDDDSDFSDDADDSDASSSGASGGDDSDDSSGDWSDMERKAEQEDDEAEDDESSEDERPRKRARTGNAAPPQRGGGMMGRPAPGRR